MARFRKPAMSPELSMGFTHIILYKEAHLSLFDHIGEMSIEYEMPIRRYSILISLTSLIQNISWKARILHCNCTAFHEHPLGASVPYFVRYMS